MNGRIKIITCLAVGALAVTALVRLAAPPAPARADYGTSLSVSPQQQVVNVGDNVDVTVILSTDVGATGLQVGLDYDPAILEPIYSVPLPPAPTPTPSAGWPVSYTEGNLFKDWASSVGGSTLVSQKPKGNRPGHITLFGLTCQNVPIDGLSATGDVVTFHLKAIGNGVSTLHLAGDPSSGGGGDPGRIEVVGGGSNPGPIPNVILNDGEVFVGVTPTPAPIPTETPTESAGPSPTPAATEPPTATTVSTNTPLPLPTATSPSNTRLSVSPSTQTVAIGATVDVAVSIDTQTASRGAQFGLNFNNRYLTYTGFTEGSFYKDWATEQGDDTLIAPQPADQGSGHLSSFGIAITGTSTGGPTGTGTVVTYHFTASTAGTSNLTLVQAVVTDDQGSTIPGSTADAGTVVVSNSTVTPTPSATMEGTGTPQGTGTPGAGVASNSTVAISPTTQTVPPGAAFDVSVTLTTDANIRGAQGKLAFDPTLLEVDSVSEGSFLKDWASGHGDSTMEYPQPSADNSAGTVSDIGISMMGTNPGGPTGTGILFIYHMKAKSTEGTANLTLSDVVLSNENAATLAGPTITNGQVVVQVGAVAPTATPSSGGSGSGGSYQSSGSGGGSGGSGGGGGSTVGPTSATNTGSSAAPNSQVEGAGANLWKIDLSGSIGADGMVKKDIQWISPDGKVRLQINAHTAALDDNGKPITSIEISQESSPEPAPGDWAAISSAFVFQVNDPPSMHATFNPPISLSFQYDPSLMPPGVNDNAPQLAFLDTSATPPSWQKLNTVVDPIAHMVSAKISHFSTFGAFANPRSGLPFNPWVLGGILGSEALLGAAAYQLIQTRRRRRIALVKAA